MSARIRSGIIPDEDDLQAVIPDVTIDNLHFSPPNTDILTQSNADRSLAIVSDAFEDLVTARATVGGLLDTTNAAINNMRRVVELKTVAHAEILTANIAKETTNLTNGRTLLFSATETQRQFAALQQVFSDTVVAMLDSLG